MLALENTAGIVAVDCGGDLVQRMLACGLDIDRMEALFITHDHSDHVTGFPLAVQRLWLHGRRRPLRVLGPAPALDVARRVWDVFKLDGEDGMPGIEWESLPTNLAPASPADSPLVLSVPGWDIQYVAGSHGPETIALRFTDRESGEVVTYSSDTEPEQRIVALAAGCGILVHEATGAGPGHSSVQEAADVAARAGVGRLLLVHLPPARTILPDEMEQARRTFSEIELGEEGGRYPLGGLIELPLMRR